MTVNFDWTTHEILGAQVKTARSGALTPSPGLTPLQLDKTEERS